MPSLPPTWSTWSLITCLVLESWSTLFGWSQPHTVTCREWEASTSPCALSSQIGHRPESSLGSSQLNGTWDVLGMCSSREKALGRSSSDSVLIVQSYIQFFVNPWSLDHQAPLSMEFSRQENWSGLPLPSLGDLSNPEIEPKSPVLQADSFPSEPPGKPHKGPKGWIIHVCSVFSQSSLLFQEASVNTGGYKTIQYKWRKIHTSGWLWEDDSSPTIFHHFYWAQPHVNQAANPYWTQRLREHSQPAQRTCRWRRHMHHLYLGLQLVWSLWVALRTRHEPLLLLVFLSFCHFSHWTFL